MNRAVAEEAPKGMYSRHQELLLRAYEAFNRQDLQTLLSLVDQDVDWPDGKKRLRGKEVVEEYWLKQWSEIHPHDEPLAFQDLSRGTTVVRIDQVSCGLKGVALSEGEFEHVYHVQNGLLLQTDIRRL